MAGLKTSIMLQDKMSGVLRNISRATASVVSGLKNTETASTKAFDPSNVNRMKQSLKNTADTIRQATDKQRIFNAEVKNGENAANGLLGKVKGLVAAYAGMRTVKGLVELSDQMAQNYARLNLMNDGLQTTADLLESVRNAAKASRGDFQDTFSFVAKIGNTARGAFKNSKEIVKFAELIQKSFKISGTAASEASNAMLQLSQALGAGVLRGEDLRSILGQAPGLIQLIAKELDVDVGKIRKMGEEGKLTADVIRNAVFNAADDINEKFSQIPMTWRDVWTNLKTDAISALEPVLGVINRLANNQSVVKMTQGITDALGYLAVAAGWVIEKISAVYEFFVNNWIWIGPIVYGVVGALAVYQIATKAAAIATSIMELVLAGVNAKLLIAVAIIGAVVAGFVLLCRWLGKTNSDSKSLVSQFVSGLYIIGAWFKNVFDFIKADMAGVWAQVEAVAHNFNVAFHNAIASVTSYFWQFMSDAMYVIGAIAKALSKLPFVNFDYEGIFSKADAWSKKSGETYGTKKEYTNLQDAYSSAFDRAGGNNVFAEGWKENAAKSGEDAFNNLKSKFTFNMNAVTGAEGYGETLNSIADDTNSIAKNLSTTNEELTWLRDLAEREAINRFTTAEIKVDMTGMTNEIHRDTDIDGLFNGLATSVDAALRTAAAGVY